MPVPSGTIIRARAAVRTDLDLGVDLVLCQAPEPIGDVVEPKVATACATTDAAQTVSAPVEPVIEAGTPAEQLAALQTTHASNCSLCSHVAHDQGQIVFGEGDPQAQLMFVGEAPGAEEERTGRPFVGPAGEKLDQMIKAMGLARADVYIASVIKSRPPENRTPLEDEIEACAPWLAAQVKIIQPKLIITLGSPASRLLLKTNLGITKLRGKLATYQCSGKPIKVMPIFHPAYLLRNYTMEVRAQMWADLQVAMKVLAD